jgi:hypothetical protein
VGEGLRRGSFAPHDSRHHALACDNPIIATENTAAADLITDFQEGLITTAGDDVNGEFLLGEM